MSVQHYPIKWPTWWWYKILLQYRDQLFRNVKIYDEKGNYQIFSTGMLILLTSNYHCVDIAVMQDHML